MDEKMKNGYFANECDATPINAGSGPVAYDGMEADEKSENFYGPDDEVGGKAAYRSDANAEKGPGYNSDGTKKEAPKGTAEPTI